MKNVKKVVAVILALTMLFAVSACGGGDDKDSGKARVMKVAHWFNEDHPQHKSLEKFKTLMEEKTNGAIKVELYPNSQLGSEDTYIDSVKQGTVQMGATGTMIAKYLPKIYAAETPYLVSDWDTAKNVYTGDPAKILEKGFVEASGMKIAAITVNGFREFSSNKKISSMADFKGQRIRVPNVPNYIKMVEALGATPITMSLTEVFTAMETDAVDGQDNPYPTVVTSSFYEVQKYELESRHMFSPMFWVMNDSWYNGLSDDEKKAVDESVKEASDYNWELSEDFDNESKATLKEKGMKINVPEDAFMKQMQDAMNPVYEWYFKEFEGSEEFIKAAWDLQGKKY